MTVLCVVCIAPRCAHRQTHPVGFGRPAYLQACLAAIAPARNGDGLTVTEMGKSGFMAMPRGGG